MYATSAPASATSILRITADKVAFYYERFSIKADGNVRLEFDNKSAVTGQTLELDLRSNRLLVAGGVRLTAGSVAHDGAALSVDFDTGRAYFIALEPTPQLWTYRNTTFANPEVGSEQPPNAFNVTNFSDFVPNILARRVTVGTRSFMRFSFCRVAPIGGVAFYIPLPSMYTSFSKDPNLAQTTLAAANAGAKIKFTGNTNATTAIALNYASTTKFGIGFEQNVIWEKGWGDLSVFPINQSSRFISAIVSDAPSQTFGFQVSTVSNSYSSGPSLADSSARFSYIQLTQSLHVAYLQLNYQLANSNLLATPPNSYSYGSNVRFGPMHPSSVQLGINSSNWQLVPGLEATVGGGYTYNHNGEGLQQFGGVTYTTIWSPYAAFALFTPRLSLHRNNATSPYLVIQASEQRQWYSLPHDIVQTATGASLTQPLRIGAMYLDYNIKNVKDKYSSGQREAYPLISPSQDPGYGAFEGFATFRTLTLGLTYTQNPFLAVSVAASKNNNFPGPSPAVLDPVQQTFLGVNPIANYLGEPPYDLPVALRIRLNGSLSLNLQATYYFNYFGNGWNNFQVQFLQ